MQKLQTLWRHLFDIRAEELGRTVPMFFYLLLVLFAYYILKPVSSSMFLDKFDIDKLPWLYILIALFGGILAYFYSKLAARTSLSTAVFWSMLLSIVCLVVIWYMLSIKVPVHTKKGVVMVAKFRWMIYVFNVWTSLFAVTLVAQGWLVASNIFNAREAKRVYGLLGIALVIGAWFGGEFTHMVVKYTGTTNLLLAAAALVVLAYIAFRFAAAQKGVSLSAARAGDDEEAHFSLRDMVADVLRTRHLQVIVSIMVMIFIVDSLVDFQFKAMAQNLYEGDELTAYMGRFMGTYLNLTEFIFQFFLTGLIVGRFGVGGTMQVMPIAVALASLGTALMPTATMASIARVTEASTRYSLNRTGLELLYMPLSMELRNRVKAFIDIFMDRFARGMGGVILLVLFRMTKGSEISQIVRWVAILAIALTVPWVLLSLRARREYVTTIRKRLATRQLDIESARVTVEDNETLALLERTAAGSNARQAAYALGLLGECPAYDLKPQLLVLVSSPHAEVRAKVFELARRVALAELRQRALEEIRSADPAVVPSAVAYVLSISPDRNDLAKQWIDDANPLLAGAALEGMDRDQITKDWIEATASDPSAPRRALAAKALGLAGDQDSEALHRLLNDHDTKVVAAACRAAGALRSRAYIHDLVWILPNPHLRGEAVNGLAAYGPRICGSLGDILEDRTVAARIRRHIPRVLKQIADQRSVDVLLKATIHSEPQIRDMALKALNRLRASAPRLHFEPGFITPQIMTEARSYFELNAALAPLREFGNGGITASLLRRSLEERLHKTMDRVFRLLALQYPPKEIYSAFLAVERRRADELSAALEFLDNVVDREVKRILIPLVDAPSHLAQRGKELFSIEPRSAEAALRELAQSGDPWLAPCAKAAAVELNLRGAMA